MSWHFFHSDDVDQLIPFKEAVQITENALRDMISSDGVCAPRKRLNLHRNIAEGSDTVLNIYAGGAASYGAIGAQVALHRKAIAGRTQKRPAFNPDQTELALIYDSDTGSLLGVMAHRPRDFTAVADLRTPATSLAGLDLFARKDAKRVGIYGAGQQAWATFAGLCKMRAIESAKVYSPTPAHREGFAKKIMAKTECAGGPRRCAGAGREGRRHYSLHDQYERSCDRRFLAGSGAVHHFRRRQQYRVGGSGNLDAPRREIDDGTLRRCDLIVALSKSQAIDSQQGDIYWPVQSGVITWDKVVEISDVLAGKAAGRTDDKQIILYKNQGGQGYRRYCAGEKVLRPCETAW